MTIELSLRRRALQSRMTALILFGIVLLVLVKSYYSIPFLAVETLKATQEISIAGGESRPTTADKEQDAKNHSGGVPLFSVGALALGVSTIAFCAYLLGKGGFIELESARRLDGLADALCLCGGDFSRLEKAAEIFVPVGKYSAPENTAVDDLKALAEIVDKIRKPSGTAPE